MLIAGEWRCKESACAGGWGRHFVRAEYLGIISNKFCDLIKMHKKKSKNTKLYHKE
jgi:hypothetical protein